MKSGTLVSPLIYGDKESIQLTPTNQSEDLESWIDWNKKEIGIVLSNKDKICVKVLISGGIGFCFEDELIEIV